MSLTPLAKACEAWTPAAEAHAQPLHAISGAWGAIVGAQVAKHSRPLELKGTTLVVLTRSHAWTHQLSFMNEQILRALQQNVHSAKIEKVRFKVGRLAPASVPQPTLDPQRSVPRQRIENRGPAKPLGEAIARFREDVNASQRAKAASGWQECVRCGVPLASAKSARCIPCAQAEADQRQRKVARLLFEAPWLGFDGIGVLVEGLTERDYRAVRLKVLRRWLDTLMRAQRAGRLSPNRRERLIASSYVILKSGLDPERIVPAVVRNLLGDELHDLIYGPAN